MNKLGIADQLKRKIILVQFESLQLLSWKQALGNFKKATYVTA